MIYKLITDYPFYYALSISDSFLIHSVIIYLDLLFDFDNKTGRCAQEDFPFICDPLPVES